MNPYFDVNSCLLVQIFAVSVKYVGDPEVSKPGLVYPPDGKETLMLEPENRMGWTAVNLFKRNSVNAGVHHLPIFDEQPSPVKTKFMRIFVSIQKKLFKQKLSEVVAKSGVKRHSIFHFILELMPPPFLVLSSSSATALQVAQFLSK